MMKMVWVLALTLPMAAVAGDDIEERRDMAADGTVSVTNIAGEIEVATWDRNELHLTGDLGDGSELRVDASGGDVRIEVKPRSKGRHGNVDDSDLYLMVPQGASLSLHGVSADITVTGSKGARLDIETVSGDLEVVAETQSLDLSSVSGDVNFTGASVRTSAETVSGDIELDGVSGALDVKVVSGDAHVRGGSFSRGQFESVSGNLELSLAVERGGRVTLETMSGDAYLYLPREQGAEIRAQSFSGDIRSDFGEPERPGHGPGTRLQHVAGEGGATIRVESFSGDVEIIRR
ncbi:DUF4097 domain-containing protein [Marinihelvus fidelis]|uniref:DUF4097 domain-containing protein n=1 Tax=Marinihelvus fidelis TaxID=2613842 RepID=A0A5N0T8D4_9GAMM|nr:DUF4097 family beta strand repeat-containing protein [Marinihelvus fidelis]KAA9129569.1 DUF4097 domain-containing protein [Marinihelvus fidelis]